MPAPRSGLRIPIVYPGGNSEKTIINIQRPRINDEGQRQPFFAKVSTFARWASADRSAGRLRSERRAAGGEGTAKGNAASRRDAARCFLVREGKQRTGGSRRAGTSGTRCTAGPAFAPVRGGGGSACRGADYRFGRIRPSLSNSTRSIAGRSRNGAAGSLPKNVLHHRPSRSLKNMLWPPCGTAR